MLKTDPGGWLLYWESATALPTTSASAEGGGGGRAWLELSTVSDVRFGKAAARALKDADRVLEALGGGAAKGATGSAGLEAACLALVTAPSFVDLTFTSFLAPSPEIAQVHPLTGPAWVSEEGGRRAGPGRCWRSRRRRCGRTGRCWRRWVGPTRGSATASARAPASRRPPSSSPPSARSGKRWRRPCSPPNSPSTRSPIVWAVGRR